MRSKKAKVRNNRQRRRGRYQPSMLTHHVPQPLRREPPPADEVIDPAAGWLVVRVAPRREKATAERLKREGFRQWLPMAVTQVRRRRRGLQVITDERVPLMPGYVFALPAQGRYPSSRIDGVIGLVKAGEDVLVMTEQAMRALLQAHIEGDVVDPVVSASPFSRGARVRITDGAFADFEAQVRRVTKGRLDLDIGILGRISTLSVPLASVAAL